MVWEVCGTCHGARQVSHLENGVMKYETCTSCNGTGGRDIELKSTKPATADKSDSLGLLVGLASIALGFAAAFGLPTQSDEQRLGLGIAVTVFSHWILNMKIVREIIRLAIGIAFFYLLYLIWTKNG